MRFKQFYEEYGQKRNMVKQVTKRVISRTKHMVKHRRDPDKMQKVITKDTRKEMQQTTQFYKSAIAKAKAKGDREAVIRLQKKLANAKKRWANGHM